MNDSLTPLDYTEVSDGRLCSAWDSDKGGYCEDGAAYLVEFSNGETYPLCDECVNVSHLD